MNIPNLPTDNLYKFFAVLGMILLLAGSVLGIEFTNHKSLLFSIGIMIIGFTISIIGFKNWYNRTQKYQDEILKTETRKYLEEQNLRIRTIQFEKEYKIYETLWQVLNKLRSEIKEIERDYEEKQGDNFDISIFLENSHPFNEAVHEFNIKYEEQRPFIPEEIYKFTERITEISAKIYSNRIAAPLLKRMDVPDEFRESIEDMDSVISELSNLIRKRIRITEEI